MKNVVFVVYLCPIAFLKASVHLCVEVVWGSYRAPNFYKHTLINMWRRMEDQTPDSIHYARKILVNQCKSASKKNFTKTLISQISRVTNRLFMERRDCGIIKFK